MKILVVGADILSFEYGGGQVYVKNLISGLLERRHEVVYLALSYKAVHVTQLLVSNTNGFKEMQLLFPSTWLKLNSQIKNEKMVVSLTEVMTDVLPQIIHAHAWKELACLAAESAGIPCVITAHHGGIVCPAGALLNQHDEICTVPASHDNCLPCCIRAIPGSKLWLPLLRLIPLDVQLRLGRWLRTRRFLYFITPLGTLALSISEKLAAIETLARYATRLIAPSPAIRDALVNNGIPASKILVVPHGIPLPQRQPLRSDLGKGPVRFLYVGRISHVKGIHVMLEAFSGLPPESYELHIVGGAVTKPEKRYLAKLQKRYASLNIVWHGSQSHEEIPQHIAECDVMVHPAIFLEVFGLTIAEALAVGRPVIASRCGGAEAQIRDGENGLLVPPNDAVELRQAIQSMIDDPARLQSMAKQTGDVVSIERHVRDLEKVYIEAIDDVAMRGKVT